MSVNIGSPKNSGSGWVLAHHQPSSSLLYFQRDDSFGTKPSKMQVTENKSDLTKLINMGSYEDLVADYNEFLIAHWNGYVHDCWWVFDKKSFHDAIQSSDCFFESPYIPEHLKPLNKLSYTSNDSINTITFMKTSTNVTPIIIIHNDANSADRYIIYYEHTSDKNTTKPIVDKKNHIFFNNDKSINLHDSSGMQIWVRKSPKITKSIPKSILVFDDTYIYQDFIDKIGRFENFKNTENTVNSIATDSNESLPDVTYVDTYSSEQTIKTFNSSNYSVDNDVVFTKLVFNAPTNTWYALFTDSNTHTIQIKITNDFNLILTLDGNDLILTQNNTRVNIRFKIYDSALPDIDFANNNTDNHIKLYNIISPLIINYINNTSFKALSKFSFIFPPITINTQSGPFFADYTFNNNLHIGFNKIRLYVNINENISNLNTKLKFYVTIENDNEPKNTSNVKLFDLGNDYTNQTIVAELYKGYYTLSYTSSNFNISTTGYTNLQSFLVNPILQSDNNIHSVILNRMFYTSSDTIWNTIDSSGLKDINIVKAKTNLMYSSNSQVIDFIINSNDVDHHITKDSYIKVYYHSPSTDLTINQLQLITIY